MINGVQYMIEGIRKYGEMFFNFSSPTWKQVEVFATWFIYSYNRKRPKGYRRIVWEGD